MTDLHAFGSEPQLQSQTIVCESTTSSVSMLQHRYIYNPHLPQRRGRWGKV